MNVINGKLIQHQQPAAHSDTAADAMPSVMEGRADGQTRYGDVVLPVRSAVRNVGSRPENVMKRKTLRRCGDGQVSVSESFTESEAAEDGIHSTFFSLVQEMRIMQCLHEAIVDAVVGAASLCN